jgi:hypothetical protein
MAKTIEQSCTKPETDTGSRMADNQPYRYGGQLSFSWAGLRAFLHRSIYHPKKY